MSFRSGHVEAACTRARLHAGYKAAVVNDNFVANAVLTTDETVSAMR
jgi:hypothetical protein